VKFIITFQGVSGSLGAEQALKRAACPCAIDAAPRSLGASCVYIIRAQAPGPEELARILTEAHITWERILEDESG
jgi:hypothetical protein